MPDLVDYRKCYLLHARLPSEGDISCYLKKTAGCIAWGRITFGLAVLLLAYWKPRATSAQRPPTSKSDTAEPGATAQKSGLQLAARRDGAPGGVKTLAQPKDGYLGSAPLWAYTDSKGSGSSRSNGASASAR
jgi:hypothetical protein